MAGERSEPQGASRDPPETGERQDLPAGLELTHCGRPIVANCGPAAPVARSGQADCASPVREIPGRASFLGAL